MEDFQVAVHAFAGAACIGGVPDAHMVDAMTISGQKKIHMIRRIQMNRHEQHGATGINKGNRLIGAEEEDYIQSITANDLKNTLDAKLLNVWIVVLQCIRMDT